MARYPYARIARLTGLNLAPWQDQATTQGNVNLGTTPATLNGSPQSVSSYALTIGYTDDHGRGWWVYDGTNSPTTNRHVVALKRVLDYNRYAPTDEIRHDAAGMDRFIPRRLWAKTPMTA